MDKNDPQTIAVSIPAPVRESSVVAISSVEVMVAASTYDASTADSSQPALPQDVTNIPVETSELNTHEAHAGVQKNIQDDVKIVVTPEHAAPEILEGEYSVYQPVRADISLPVANDDFLNETQTEATVYLRDRAADAGSYHRDDYEETIILRAESLDTTELNLPGETKKESDVAAFLLDRAQQSYQRGNYEKARIQCQRAMVLEPTAARAYLVLARIELAEGLLSRAAETARQGLKTTSNKDPVFEQLNQILAEVEDLHASAELTPENSSDLSPAGKGFNISLGLF